MQEVALKPWQALGDHSSMWGVHVVVRVQSAAPLHRNRALEGADRQTSQQFSDRADGSVVVPLKCRRLALRNGSRLRTFVKSTGAGAVAKRWKTN